MKILIVHNGYLNRGGEDENIDTLVRVLKNNGNEVRLYTRSNKEIEELNVFAKISTVFGVLFSLKTYNEVREIIKTFEPDLIHVHNIFPLISPSVYWAAKKCHIPVVQTLHNFRICCMNGLMLRNSGQKCELCMNGNFIYGAINKCYRDSYFLSSVMALSLCLHRMIGTFRNKIDLYIAPSEFVKTKMAGAFNESNKIVVVQHFIEGSCKAEINITNEIYCIYIGRLSREKGLLTLVNAFAKLKSIQLKILGIGPMEEELKAYLAGHSILNISMMGFVSGEQKEEMLRKAVCLVIPSECNETFGLPVIEAFRCGVPVAASRSGALAEIIEEGVTGYLFESGNPEDLAVKVNKIISDREGLLRMKKHAQNTYELRYSSAAGYKKIIEIYERVLKTA